MRGEEGMEEGEEGGKLSIKEIRQVNPGHFPTGGQISEISAS